jgi:uncharacterized protein YlxP (DUF503 family)
MMQQEPAAVILLLLVSVVEVEKTTTWQGNVICTTVICTNVKKMQKTLDYVLPL